MGYIQNGLSQNKADLNRTLNRVIVTELFMVGFLLNILSLHQYTNPNASSKSQADVLLRPIPKFLHPEDLLPRCKVQQKQHCPACQVVQ